MWNYYFVTSCHKVFIIIFILCDKFWVCHKNTNVKKNSRDDCLEISLHATFNPGVWKSFGNTPTHTNIHKLTDEETHEKNGSVEKSFCKFQIQKNKKIGKVVSKDLSHDIVEWKTPVRRCRHQSKSISEVFAFINHRTNV